MIVQAVYERVETWGKNGLLPYGVRVWRPRGVPARVGSIVGTKRLHNGTLVRDQLGRVEYTRTYPLTVLVVDLGGGEFVYCPQESRRRGSGPL